MYGETRRLSTPRSLALTRLKRAVGRRLTDPGLDRAGAARAAGMSLRYANALLAEEGASLARLIRDMRLDRCCAALDDPAQDHRTIGEIAFG